jgi:hypothetical protein
VLARRQDLEGLCRVEIRGRAEIDDIQVIELQS